jgi:hypothetical protein
MNLPDKPAQIAHVSDDHWEAALRRAWAVFKIKKPGTVDFEAVHWGAAEITPTIIDHARLLILQGEVQEPVGQFEVKCGLIVQDWYSASATPKSMADIIRKHLAGMTIPEKPQ